MMVLFSFVGVGEGELDKKRGNMPRVAFEIGEPSRSTDTHEAPAYNQRVPHFFLFCCKVYGDEVELDEVLDCNENPSLRLGHMQNNNAQRRDPVENPEESDSLVSMRRQQLIQSPARSEVARNPKSYGANELLALPREIVIANNNLFVTTRASEEQTFAPRNSYRDD